MSEHPALLRNELKRIRHDRNLLSQANAALERRAKAAERERDELRAALRAADALRKRVRREDKLEDELGRWSEAAEYDDARAAVRIGCTCVDCQEEDGCEGCIDCVAERDSAEGERQ